jgi:hypothetical protein
MVVVAVDNGMVILMDHIQEIMVDLVVVVEQ